jgi:acyl-CoA dehydrogenase
MGWHCSDTAAIYFEDVEVPAENLIGVENGGFIGIMRNFNSERLGMAMGCCSFARVCLKEAAEWAQQRETFGKPLVGHQSIRIKLADMARQINATQVAGGAGRGSARRFCNAQGAGHPDAGKRCA